MKKLNPIERSQYIDSRYKEYLRSSFQFGNNNEFQSLFDKELSNETLFKGPYVALNLPFKRGKNINELIEEGVICQSFKKLNDINYTRSLYAHQEEAIRRIGAGRSAIVTTGTGSGKTECFLYPILNELMSDIENGNKDIGVRAIFLYPMNALVNDQIERVRKILTGCKDITYGFFTGEVKEIVTQNDRETYGQENGTTIPENELVSRAEIRQNPPHLLFTNYSMLEYLLIRPNDYAIFAPERLRNWKYVVLDEAHTYSGSLGIEISMLMRRLTALAEKKPRFILTSATLGEQGKSEAKILDFAKRLTSAQFEQDDIIFSKRIPLKKNICYSISCQDYTEIKNHIEDASFISSMCSKYNTPVGTDIASSVYELLCRDEHVYQIYEEVLKEKAISFTKLLALIKGIDENNLIALIDLINLADKNGIELFELKYHSFVRPLSGAFITLGAQSELSLTKTNTIGDLKAFEVGNCRFCNAPYIIGKIQHNNADGLDYLFQNKEVDIYENYGNNEFVKIDYFLMSDSVTDYEGKKELEDYTLCAKCGCIYATANLNARKCNCESTYQRTVYRVKQNNKDDEPTAFNNINSCPCCKHKSQGGIVRNLSLGKDEGTALIAQTLYEAIDDDDSIKPRKPEKRSLILGDKIRNLPEKSIKVKQFLSFSDSRQQASFSAVFFDANHVRMLRKRLIWKIIEDQSYKPLTVDELAAYLTKLIKDGELFHNNLSAHKNAWVALLVDLLKVDGSYDGEGLGLYFFDLDLSEIMDQIDENDVKELFGEFNIDKTDLATIIQVVFDIFKTTPAIEYVKSTLTPEEKLENLDFRRFDNYVMYECPKSTKTIRSFLPIKKGDSNMVVRYVQKVCKCDETDAIFVLDTIFNNLAVESGLLKKHPSKEAYQIEASKYIVRNYKKCKYYRCSKCGRLTPYNVHNVCVQDKCDGELLEVNPDEVLANNYYRNQYKTKKIESIVIKEHTAQLDRTTAREYQQDLGCYHIFERRERGKYDKIKKGEKKWKSTAKNSRRVSHMKYVNRENPQARLPKSIMYR